MFLYKSGLSVRAAGLQPLQKFWEKLNKASEQEILLGDMYII